LIAFAGTSISGRARRSHRRERICRLGGNGKVGISSQALRWEKRRVCAAVVMMMVVVRRIGHVGEPSRVFLAG
jgi:hypothetical protein